VDVTVTAAHDFGRQTAGNTDCRAHAQAEESGAAAHRSDAKLIGGAVIRAGDLVIDGSLRTRLERMAFELSA